MPRGDGTGPNGQGPLTGRGRGYCAGYNSPGFANGVPAGGRGMAWRRGRGRGFRLVSQPQLVPVQQVQPQPVSVQQVDERQLLEQDKEDIKEEVKALKEELDQIEKRLKEIE